jgi:hypothetical protein
LHRHPSENRGASLLGLSEEMQSKFLLPEV